MVCLCGDVGWFVFRIIEWFAGWKQVAAAWYVVANNEIDVYAGGLLCGKRWVGVRGI